MSNMQKKYTREYFIRKIKSYDRLKTICEHIVLRPDDNKRYFGEIGFSNMVSVAEEKLEEYRETDLYRYYYDMKDSEHNFNNLERWLKWGRK